MASSDDEIHPNELDLGYDYGYGSDEDYGTDEDDFGTPSRGFQKYFKLFFSSVQYAIKFAWLPAVIYLGAKESNINFIEAINVYGYKPKGLEK